MRPVPMMIAPRAVPPAAAHLFDAAGRALAHAPAATADDDRDRAPAPAGG